MARETVTKCDRCKQVIESEKQKIQNEQYFIEDQKTNTSSTLKFEIRNRQSSQVEDICDTCIQDILRLRDHLKQIDLENTIEETGG